MDNVLPVTLFVRRWIGHALRFGLDSWSIHRSRDICPIFPVSPALLLPFQLILSVNLRSLWIEKNYPKSIGKILSVRFRPWMIFRLAVSGVDNNLYLGQWQGRELLQTIKTRGDVPKVAAFGGIIASKVHMLDIQTETSQTRERADQCHVERLVPLAVNPLHLQAKTLDEALLVDGPGHHEASERHRIGK